MIQMLKQLPKSLPRKSPPRKKHIVIFLLAFLLVVLTNFLIQEILSVKIPVFGFHEIIDPQNPQGLPPKRIPVKSDYEKQPLAEFLDYLVRENYWILSSQELYDHFIAKYPPEIPPEHEKQKRILLTFDDGYKTIHTQVLPILEKLEQKYGKKIKIVLFINSGFLGEKTEFNEKLTCNDLREGFQKGFYDIQSHGLNHSNLTQLDDTDLNREFSQDQINLRKCLQDLDINKTVANHIAYPFGAANNKVEEYAKKYFLSGYTYDSLKAKIKKNLDKYRISRLTINKTKSVKRMIALSGKGWLYYLLPF